METALVNIRLEMQQIEALEKLAGQALTRQSVARMLLIAAIESNARQYCPAGNRGWDERYPSMFHVHDGTLGTAVLNGPGLGYAWKDEG